ncbi:testican-1 [Elysia marginata]|uniref:Testican-1 n=1 Tax=Elysia marginata TaxID=1093978 RepID=A0AAV4IRA1_9GAST|nr:testican-1 [Elysia marginata]
MARVTCIVAALALLVCISILTSAAEARKKDKSKWMNKKAYFKALSLKGDIDNGLEDKERRPYAPKVNGNTLGGGHSVLFRKKWNRRNHGKHHKKSRSKKAKMDRRRKVGKIGKQAPWSDFVRPRTECKKECGKHELCILGPMQANPHCVHFRDLKKSMKKFRKYKKKERKAWKKFHKKSQKYFKEKDVFDFKKPSKFDETTLVRGKLDLDKELRRKRKELMEAEGRKSPPMFALEPFEAGDPKDERQSSTDKEPGDKCECMKSAMWEFHQMDEDGDDNLTHKEMGILENNRMEPCMKPYLNSCDQDADDSLSSAEWCCCFSNILGPCYRAMNKIRRSGEPVTFMPRCDKEGYYMAEQCKRVDDDSFECWCVDYNGNETDGTRTNGRAHCSMCIHFYSLI